MLPARQRRQGAQPSVPSAFAQRAARLSWSSPSEHLIGAQFGQWPAADRAILRHRFRASGCAIPEIVERAFVSLRLPSSPRTGRKANRETLYLSPCVERSFVIACDRSELLSPFFARGSDRTVTAGCRSETSGSGRLRGAECGSTVLALATTPDARHALSFVSGATGFRSPQKGCRARNADRRCTHRVDL